MSNVLEDQNVLLYPYTPQACLKSFSIETRPYITDSKINMDENSSLYLLTLSIYQKM